jgi:signal transduction histidine kinase
MISDANISNHDTKINSLQPMFLLVLTLAGGYLLTLALNLGGTSWANIRTGLFNLPVEISATAFLARVSRIQNPSIQKMIQPLFWGVLLHLTANILNAILEFGFGNQSLPIDLMYGLSSLCFLLGFIRTGLRKTSRLELVRLSLDVTLLILTIGILFWTSFLGKIIQDSGQLLPVTTGFSQIKTDLQRLPFGGTPIDILVLCVAVIVTLRSGAQHQRLAILTTLGLTALVLFDAAMGTQLSLKLYQHGGLLNGGFVLTSTIFCLAGYLSFSPQPSSLLTRRSLASLGWLSIYAPYMAAILLYIRLIQIYIPLIQTNLSPELEEVIGVFSAMIVTVLVLVRQILILQENRSLTVQLLTMNNQLEERIVARTTELEDSRERLVSSEKLASIGQLTAGLAHEVNTPLAASLNYLHQARSLADEYAQSVGNPKVTNEDHGEIAKELQQSLQDTAITLDRLGEFVRKMRNQTRFSNNEATLFDPVGVAQDTLSMLEHQVKKTKVQIHLNPSPSGMLLRGEPGRFTQVLSNLIVNAIHACEGKEAGQVELTFGTRVQGGQTEMVVGVSDNGSGIPDAILPKVFEPLFTTKPVGKGTGLGLSIIRDIVRGHFGGEVQIQTQVGEGTTFTLFLPMGTTAARAGTDQART